MLEMHVNLDNNSKLIRVLGTLWNQLFTSLSDICQIISTLVQKKNPNIQCHSHKDNFGFYHFPLFIKNTLNDLSLSSPPDCVGVECRE